MTESGAAFGAQLRLERERRGISLERLRAETKLNPRYLDALEKGDFKALPGGVFRRGAVRAYLNCVGLAEQIWMPRFDSSFAHEAQPVDSGSTSSDNAWATFAINVKRNRGVQRRSTLKRWLGVLAMCLILLAAGWATWNLLLRDAVRH